MGRLSNADANNLLDSRFGGVAVNAPGTYFVALSTTTPTDAGGNITEPGAGAGYSRVGVVNNLTNWPAAANRAKANGAVIPYPTASAAWGTITAFALFDAATGGTFRGWGAVSPQAVAAGATPDFPVGALVINAPGT
jgi:hypothetical protein